jgi:2-octaprenyl-6-methoxyphenol hydroxylase
LESVDITADAARVEVDHDGKRLSLSARLLVAADGVNSPVREAVGIKARQVTYGQHAIVTTVGLGRSHEHTAYERFTDSGPLALLPMSGQRCAVVWSARQGDVDAIMALEDDAFLARLQQRFGGRLGRFNKIGKRKTYPLRFTCVDEHVRARLALIGNAAHTVHPVAGQGFNLGLRDIATLSEILCDEGRAGRDIGDLQVLRRYAAWRRRDNRVIANFTDGLIRIFSNDFFPLVALRGLGLVAVDLLPPVKRGLTRITSGLSGRQPRLARGLPLA